MSPADDVSRASVRVMQRGARRAIVAVSALVAPVPFSMVFVGGLMPLPWIATFFLGPGEPGGIVLFAVHLAVDLALLYLAAAVLCWVLFASLRVRRAAGVVTLVLAVEVGASLFPIYVLVGNGDPEWFSLWSLVVGTRQPARSRAADRRPSPCPPPPLLCP